MSPALPWRPARPADTDLLVAFCRALYLEDPSPHAPGPEAIRRTLEAFGREPGRGRVLVLEEAGAVHGYALLASYWSNERGGEVLFVDELYVEPVWRGRGRATALVEALFVGTPTLWPGDPVALALEVTPSNPRARALYTRLGFTPAKNALLVRMRR